MLRNVPEPFKREGPLRPFVDPKKEDYCRARAKGMNSVRASEEAGVSRQTGQAWSEREEIIDRIREHKQSTEGYTEVSVAYVLEEMKVTVLEARGAGDYKAAIEGLKALHGIITKDKTGLRAVALGMSAAQLQNPQRLRRSLTEELSRPDDALDTVAEEVPHDDGDEADA